MLMRSRVSAHRPGETPAQWATSTESRKDHRKRNNVVLPMIICAILFPTIYIGIQKYKASTRKPGGIELPEYADIRKLAPFEPEVKSDFYTGDDLNFKIPRIIHQTWKNTLIPPKFQEGIKSYMKHNPDWEYYLWTDESARDFVTDFYPHLLSTWDGYLYKMDKIRRADAIRYVVLYHFGGLYADMDTVNYRPLDKAISKHACVFTPEPYEHAVSRGLAPYLINNAVMMCAPKHPFLKFLIDNLPAWSDMQELGDATGPGFLTTQYKLYHSLPRELDSANLIFNETQPLEPVDTTPYFNQGNIPLSDYRSVYIANTHYFMHTLDEESFRPLFDMCLKFGALTHLQQRACVSAKTQGLKRKIHKFAFIDHKWHMTYAWYNFYSYMPIFNFFASTDIQSLVPHYKIYQKQLPSRRPDTKGLTKKKLKDF